MIKSTIIRFPLKLIVLLFLLLDSCATTKKCPDGVLGTFKDLEGLDGCGWVIELENGGRLQPINLDTYDFTPQEGMNISFSYAIAEAMGGICMAGKMVELTCLQLKD